MSSALENPIIHIPWILQQKRKQKLTMLTAYDYPTAVRLDKCGVDLLLVGDSVGTVLYGHANTLQVTIDDMVRHTQAVTRGAKRAVVVADMPFLSYQVSVEQSIVNAGRLIQEGHAQAVKIEGGIEVAPVIARIVQAGIPVMGHLGLTPQSINMIGQYRIFGKKEEERKSLLEAARALFHAGVFSIVLECVEHTLAEEITDSVEVPTIGIGSGFGCDGQVLVTQDLLGMTIGKVPKFVQPVADLGSELEKAILHYVKETKSRTY